MRISYKLGLYIALVLSFSVLGSAVVSAKVKTPTPHKKVVSAVCPVMKNFIPNITKAAGKSVYKGKTYYFCCPACKPKFDANPAKYIKAKTKTKSLSGAKSEMCPVKMGVPGTKCPMKTKK